MEEKLKRKHKLSLSFMKEKEALYMPHAIDLPSIGIPLSKRIILLCGNIHLNITRKSMEIILIITPFAKMFFVTTIIT